MTDFAGLLRVLFQQQVKFILVGGAAAVAHGASRLTLDIDLLGEITGGGGYDSLIHHSLELKIFGAVCRCINIEKLIEVKRAAGRPKDFEVIAELEALQEESE